MTTLAHPAPQGTAEWTAERLGKFTASDIHKLMGKPRSADDLFTATAMTYILERAAETITGLPTPSVSSAATEWGVENEPLAREWYTRKTGNIVTPVGFVPMGMMAGGSPDGLVGDNGLIEIKCPFNTVNHLRNCLLTPDTIRSEAPEYFYQIQANLLFTHRSWAHFISFDPRVDRDYGLFIMQVDRDEAVCDAINYKITAAWTELQAITNKLNSIK